ncbi:MAG TPA: lysylphosphatidylglycerol synthase domain-containing protein [Gaiellaceae bacterium]|nr:lysylphosphatidylglycerol synthase domain-containing protein [Gaiellaceae bacterium]
MRRLLRNKKVQVAVNGGLGLGLLLVAWISARHFMKGGWPLHHADPVLVVASAVLFLIAYAFKAFGWQRLFREEERPHAGALAFAGASACVGGVAMPGRVDDAIRIACVRKFPGTRAGLGTIGLSLIVLGLLDNAALAPLAGVAIADAQSWMVRAGFLVVAVAGVLAAVVVAMLPKFAGMRRVMRFKLGRWLSEHTQNRRESLAALFLIFVSWALRGTAVFLLLNALALKGSFPLALGFLCASAASAAVPIGPAGAAMQAGAGAALLAMSGVPKAEALAFSVATQALIVVTGAALILLIAAWQVVVRIRLRPAAAAA